MHYIFTSFLILFCALFTQSDAGDSGGNQLFICPLQQLIIPPLGISPRVTIFKDEIKIRVSTPDSSDSSFQINCITPLGQSDLFLEITCHTKAQQPSRFNPDQVPDEEFKVHIKKTSHSSLNTVIVLMKPMRSPQTIQIPVHPFWEITGLTVHTVVRDSDSLQQKVEYSYFFSVRLSNYGIFKGSNYHPSYRKALHEYPLSRAYSGTSEQSDWFSSYKIPSSESLSEDFMYAVQVHGGSVAQFRPLIEPLRAVVRIKFSMFVHLNPGVHHLYLCIQVKQVVESSIILCTYINDEHFIYFDPTLQPRPPNSEANYSMIPISFEVTSYSDLTPSFELEYIKFKQKHFITSGKITIYPISLKFQRGSQHKNPTDGAYTKGETERSHHRAPDNPGPESNEDSEEEGSEEEDSEEKGSEEEDSQEKRAEEEDSQEEGSEEEDSEEEGSEEEDSQEEGSEEEDSQEEGSEEEDSQENPPKEKTKHTSPNQQMHSIHPGHHAQHSAQGELSNDALENNGIRLRNSSNGTSLGQRFKPLPSIDQVPSPPAGQTILLGTGGSEQGGNPIIPHTFRNRIIVLGTCCGVILITSALVVASQIRRVKRRVLHSSPVDIEMKAVDLEEFFFQTI